MKVVNERLNSLDQLFQVHKIKKIDFLKVDCEGCEYDLLLKTTNKFFNRIEKIALEAHLFDKSMRISIRRLKKRFKASGMKVSVVDNPVHEYLCFLYAERY